jgi:hypothetical protein
LFFVTSKRPNAILPFGTNACLIHSIGSLYSLYSLFHAPSSLRNRMENPTHAIRSLNGPVEHFIPSLE